MRARRSAVSPVIARASRRRSAFRRAASVPIIVPSRSRVAPLAPHHRARVREILDRTRAFNAAEIAVALELFDESYPPPSEPQGAARDPIAVLTPPVSSDYVFLGAFTPDDELIGYACYGPTPDTDGTYDLYWIAVDPEAQGAGSGTILLLEVERRLQGLNARLLVVETSSRSDYQATRRFYQRHAYVEAAEIRGYFAPFDNRIILTKRFPTQHPSPAPRGAWSESQ